MDHGWLARLRWRRRGAWLWPVFVVLVAVDAVVGHALPPSGDAESFVGAALAGLVLSLLAVLFLSRPLGALLRRSRPDLPRVVARNYAGTAAVVMVSAVLLAAGIAHHPTVVAHQNAMRDAIVRAEAWIGAHATAPFLRNLALLDTYTIQAGSIYRSCVPSTNRLRSYCVIVNTQQPFARSVTFSGYEPNSVFAAGLG
jgi:hypothetical protein